MAARWFRGQRFEGCQRGVDFLLAPTIPSEFGDISGERIRQGEPSSQDMFAATHGHAIR